MIESGPLLTRALDVLRADKYLSDNVAQFRVGELKNMEAGHDFPLVYITTDSPFMTNADRTGTGQDGYDSQYTVRLKFVIVVNDIGRLSAPDGEGTGDASPEAVKRELLEICQNVHRVLVENPRLRMDGADPKFVRSLTSDWVEEQRLRGNMMQMASMRLQGQIGVQWTAIISPEGGDQFEIPMLAKPAQTTANGVDIDILDDGTRMYTGTDRHGTLAIEYEDEPAVFERVRAIMDVRCYTTITLRRGDGRQRTFITWPYSQQSTYRFDDLDRLVATWEIIR